MTITHLFSPKKNLRLVRNNSTTGAAFDVLLDVFKGSIAFLLGSHLRRIWREQ